MKWLMYPAAVLFGAAVCWAITDPPPDYKGEWEITSIRTVPNGPSPQVIQRPFVYDNGNPEDLCIERFAKLPALTERLKVPETTDVDPSVVIEMCDGRKWDLFDIMQAFLDRMEQK